MTRAPVRRRLRGLVIVALLLTAGGCRAAAGPPTLVTGEYRYEDPVGGEAVVIVVGKKDFLRVAPDLGDPDGVLAVFDGDVYLVYPDARLISVHRGDGVEPISPDERLLDPVFLSAAAAGRLPPGLSVAPVPAPARAADGLVPVPAELTVRGPDGQVDRWRLIEPRREPSVTPRAYIEGLLANGYRLQEGLTTDATAEQPPAEGSE